MRRSLLKPVSRLLSILMMATFLSPGIGWAIAATDHQLGHAGAGLADTTFEHDHEHGDDGNTNHDHADAHAFFGHLIGHLTMGFTGEYRTPIAHAVRCDFPDPELHISVSIPDPPFRPPCGLVLA